MTPQQIAARIRRLGSLVIGLRSEHQAAGENGALTLEERSEFLEDIRRAAAALEAARVPLERALRRHRGASGRVRPGIPRLRRRRSFRAADCLIS
jgi:hypothetical protein